MAVNTRRNFFGRIAAMAALVTGAPKLFAQQAAQQAPTSQAPAAGSLTPAGAPGGDAPRRPGGGNHTHDGIYYFSGTGSMTAIPGRTTSW